MQNLSTETRPYHSEKQEEGRQKTDATTLKKKKGEKRKQAHMGLVQTGVDPQTYPQTNLHTHISLLSSSEPGLTHTFFRNLTLRTLIKSSP